MGWVGVCQPLCLTPFPGQRGGAYAEHMDTSNVSQIVAAVVQCAEAAKTFDARFGTPPPPWRQTPIPGGGHGWVNRGLGLTVVASLCLRENGEDDIFLVSVSTSSGRKAAPHQLDIVKRVFMARIGGEVSTSRERGRFGGGVITYMAGKLAPIEAMAN